MPLKDETDAALPRTRLQPIIVAVELPRTEGGLKIRGAWRDAGKRPSTTTGFWLQSYLILTMRLGAISQGRGVEKPKGMEQMEIDARGRSSRRGCKAGSCRFSPPRHLRGDCEVLDRCFF